MKLDRKTKTEREARPTRRKEKAPAGGLARPAGKRPRPRPGDSREELIRGNVDRHKRRHKKNYVLYYILLLFLLLVVGVTLSLTVFFKIETISVVGNGSISAEQLIADSGLQLGENLFRTNTDRAARSVVEKNVNIDSVVVSRKLPDTMEIRVELSEVAAVVWSDGKYYSLSGGNRIVRIADGNEEPGAVEVIGCDFSSEYLGDYVEPMTENKLETLLAVVDALEKNELTGLVRYVDISSITTIKLYYNDKVEIWLGGITNLSYELGKIKELFEKQTIDSTAYGRLDATVSGKYYYLPLESLELPDQSPADLARLSPETPNVVTDTPPDEEVPLEGLEAPDSSDLEPDEGAASPPAPAD